jgi:rSAM/selenodomain-associated transferase 1
LIIVFAKAPVLGRAKTRLIPRLGAWRAARLHERLVRQALRTARLAGEAVELHGTSRHRFFSSLNVRFRLQRGTDLGERMHHAFSRARGPAVLIGSDCPMLTARDLRTALRWLHGGYDAVLAPADDGGYALIALRRPRRELFEGIDWGSARVYSQTVRKLEGYRWRALRTVWDVDRPEDLPRLSELRLRSLRLPSASRRASPR